MVQAKAVRRADARQVRHMARARLDSEDGVAIINNLFFLVRFLRPFSLNENEKKWEVHFRGRSRGVFIVKF